MTGEPLDIGHGHTIRFTRWSPDRELNPQYADAPDIDPVGLHVDHLTPDGKPCAGGITFDSEAARKLRVGREMWTLVSLDPLTVTPSLLCHCGDHGFITNGRWVPA